MPVKHQAASARQGGSSPPSGREAFLSGGRVTKMDGGVSRWAGSGLHSGSGWGQPQLLPNPFPLAHILFFRNMGQDVCKKKTTPIDAALKLPIP